MCLKTNTILLLIIILPCRFIYTQTDTNQNTNSTITPIDKCFQQDSINIAAPKGSDGDLLTLQIPENRLSDHVYEIMDNPRIMLTDNSTRSCVCELRQCIQLCSYNLHDLYNDMIENNRSSEDMQIFYIGLTLVNGTIVSRHIIHDFQTIVFNSFCDRHYSLSPEQDSKNSWALFENETLLRHHDETYLTGREYCFEVDDDDPPYHIRINPLNCAIENSMSTLEVANNTTMVISIPFFLLTILAYCLIPELLNIHGKCFISYLSSITLSYSLLSCINLTRIKLEFGPCILLGFLNHYLQLAHYTWLGIICFDTWKLFSNLWSNTSYGGYACFGWSMPLVWTILTVLAQISDMPDSLKPGITPQHCGLEVNKWSATIYLYGPCLVVLVFCLVSFILTSRIIKKNDTDVNPYHSGYDGHKFRYTLYLRLFVVMGLSWFMDVVSYLFAMFEMPTSSYIMDFINAVQGLYIFFNFIGRPQVRNILKEKLVCLHRKGTYTMDSSSQVYSDGSDQSVSSDWDKNFLAGFKIKLRAHLSICFEKIS